MPEEPTPPADAFPVPEEEWTDDLDPTQEDSELSQTEENDVLEEEWEEAALAWDEEIAETPPPPPASPTTDDAIAWVRPLLRKLLASWQRLLRGVRKQIPAAANLSDLLLSSILIGILMLLLILFNGVRRPTIAAAPPAVPPAPVSQPPAIPQNQPAGGAISPAGETPSAPATSAAPGETTAGGDRIADIQAQLTDETLPLARRSIASVQADFIKNQLVVVVTEEWYRLSKYDQGELANQLLARSRTLAFDDIELRSLEGELLARKPVVGNTMVILQHEKPPAVPIPPKPKFRITVDR